MPLDTTGRLLRELKDIDEREDETLAALLEHATRLEELELRDRRVTVADLQQLKAALDDTLAKIAKAQAAAIAPAAVTVRPATNGGTSAGDPSRAVSTSVREPVIRPEPLTTPPAPPATVSELARQLNDNEAASDRLREQLAQRLHALAPIGDRVAAERAEAAGDNTAGRVRTFRLQPSLIKGGDVQAFQRVINRRFAGLRIGRRIAENGVYGPNTRKAAHQVAFCLGLITTDLEDGITPAVRAVLRSPSRRSERQKQRARGRACREYRAKLRKRYARTPHPRPDRPIGPGGAPARRIEAAIRAHGGRYEDIIVREAKRSNLPVSLVCAIVEKESGFRNVFGHDPTIFVGAGTVTKEKYLAYKQQRGSRGKGGMQGVGPCQLTWWTLQDRADVLGGCWMPGPNIRVAVEHLNRLVLEHGLAGGLRRYNGTGPAAEAYSRDVLRKKAVWDTRLAGLSSGAGSRPHPGDGPRPDAAATGRPGTGKRRARARALHWLAAHRGITEQPLGSNRDKRADGITAAQRRIGTAVGGAWCGTWCANAALAGGVKMSDAWRWASVKFIEDDAKARRNGFRGWTRDHRRVLRGDLVVLYGRGVHVEVVRKVSRMRKVVITDGGNTSSGDGGSQANGHGAYMRKRPFRAVHGYALVDYPDR